MDDLIEFDLISPEQVPLLSVNKAAVGEGKYVVQTRCPADYGHVVLRIEPYCGEHHLAIEWAVNEEDLPRIFMGAVKEGIQTSVLRHEKHVGLITNVRVTVIGGSFHMVDSRERSYVVAARRAFEDGLVKAGLREVKPISG